LARSLFFAKLSASGNRGRWRPGRRLKIVDYDSRQFTALSIATAIIDETFESQNNQRETGFCRKASRGIAVLLSAR
jgi:hypothetical protein